MIIDDERAIRNLLKITIQNQELDLEIAGEASSGIEAINTIDSIKPDIVFVDIRMPFMDGIEFSKLAIQRYPKLKIIILTAYDDFEYARSCIGIGVSAYLLKPISRTEIRETLLKVIEQLKVEKRDEDEDNIEEDNCSIAKIKEYIMKNYMEPDINLTSIAQHFCFNTCYLSRMFKQKTGMGLSDFLMKCRMERAIAYAKKGARMYLTAKEVGIPDPNYFSKCFKKYTGKLYSEYAKQDANRAENES